MTLSLFHLHGDLADLRFPRLLAALRDDEFTGVFQATTPRVPTDDAGDEPAGTTREIHFSEGRVAWAISTDRDESLKAYLIRSGAISESQWIQAEERAREGTVRDALIQVGAVNARELSQIEKGRIEAIVMALFESREGEYRVRERQLAPATPDLRVDPRPMILKGVMEGGDRALVMDEIGSLDTVFVAKRHAGDLPGLALPGEFQSILRHVDGKRSIAQICAHTSLPDYYVSSVFAALSIVGAVQRNYAKTSQKPRGEIVRGARLDVSEASAVAPDLDAGVPAQMDLPDEPPAVGSAPRPRAAWADLLPDGDAPREVLGPAAHPEAPEAIASEETAPEQASPEEAEPEEIAPEEAVAGAETEPEPEPEEVSASQPVLVVRRRDRSPGTAPPAPQPAPSVYGEEAIDDGSRPWFLMGGAAAVGFAVLFLILMGHGAGGAGEESPPTSSIAGGSEADIPESPNEPESAEGPDRTPPPATSPIRPEEPREVAAARDRDILDRSPATPESGRRSLLAGDYGTAARIFDREVGARPGGYSIQILTACQEETVRRAVETASGASDLFILPMTHEGRSCYRVYWGRYPTIRRAEEALVRDVPSRFKLDRNGPRIARLPGS